MSIEYMLTFNNKLKKNRFDSPLGSQKHINNEISFF